MSIAMVDSIKPPKTVIANIINIEYWYCEFVADNLLGSPGQVTTPCCSPPLLDQLGQRALELELTLAPDENLCGTLGACTCFPRKDIQLRVWFVCWFGCFN